LKGRNKATGKVGTCRHSRIIAILLSMNVKSIHDCDDSQYMTNHLHFYMRNN